jgi:hypothetical protein
VVEGHGLAARTDLAWVDHDDRITVVRLQVLADPPIVLDGTAAALWRALATCVTVEALTAAMAEEYDEPTELLRNHVEVWVAEALTAGLLEPQQV